MRSLALPSRRQKRRLERYVENLLKYNPSTGARYYYGIAELSVNGGSGTGMGDYIVHYNGSEETGFVVTNITPISITGTKTWVDHSNAYGTRPEDLTLTLYRQTAGGQEETVDIQPQWTKDGDNGDQWTYTYSDLPLTDDAANVYTYRVEETQAVPEGEAGEAGDTYTPAQDGNKLYQHPDRHHGSDRRQDLAGQWKDRTGQH